jgi:hypothetical protein
MNKQNKHIGKAGSVFVAFVFVILFSFNNSSAQTVITNYSFETGPDNCTFIQTASKSINKVSNDLFSRNHGTEVSSIYGVFDLNKSIRRGKAIYSNDWLTSSSDPGSNAEKYYTFKVNTSNFSGIGLKFDLWTNENKSVKNFGILYSIDGSDFSTLGSYDISQNPGIVYCFDLNFANITELNNKSEVTIRLYGYNATNTLSFIAIDNMSVTANKYYSSKLSK